VTFDVQIVGLIPARAGPRGKNLWLLAGKPLLLWTIEAARASSSLTRLAVSTDSDEVAAIAREQGVEVIERPAELAGDETPMLPVVRHALGALGALDVLVLLQSTSPLRRAKHVDDAVALLLESGGDAVVSVVEVPHRFRPGKLLAIEDGRLVALGTDPLHRRTRPVYARNGPAVLALLPERLGDDLYGGDCRPYLMDPRDSVDVDEPSDLRLAEFLLHDPR
jgi:CMP-N,N'-diacetyllegionaminic acid synthase